MESTTPAPRGRSILFRVVRTLAVSYVLVVVVAMFFENSLLYFPSKYPEGDWTTGGMTVEDAWITTADGVKIHGWYLPYKNPQAVVLFAHGNGGNITDRADLMQRLQGTMQVASLFFDYRGYGRSEGQPSETGILADARAARKWLAEKAGIPEQDVVLMGESLGGGVAVDLAAKDGARGLVLQSTFTSLPAAAAKHFPFLPVRLVMRNRLDSLSKIDDYHGPLLQVHGTGDTVVPYELGEQLFAAANQPKVFVSIPGGNHADQSSPQFFLALDKFFKSLPAVEKQ